jgi:hypothetical protein
MRKRKRRPRGWLYWIPVVLIPLLGITYLLLPKEDKALNPGRTGLTIDSEYQYGNATIKVKHIGFTGYRRVTIQGQGYTASCTSGLSFPSMSVSVRCEAPCSLGINMQMEMERGNRLGTSNIYSDEYLETVSLQSGEETTAAWTDDDCWRIDNPPVRRRLVVADLSGVLHEAKATFELVEGQK